MVEKALAAPQNVVEREALLGPGIGIRLFLGSEKSQCRVKAQAADRIERAGENQRQHQPIGIGDLQPVEQVGAAPALRHQVVEKSRRPPIELAACRPLYETVGFEAQGQPERNGPRIVAEDVFGQVLEPAGLRPQSPDGCGGMPCTVAVYLDDGSGLIWHDLTIIVAISYRQVAFVYLLR